MTTSTTATIRCASRADLLTVPAAQFGYTPEDSLVLLRMDAQHLAFASRIDLATLELAPTTVRTQLTHAAGEHPSAEGHWIALGYASRPERAAREAERLALHLDHVSLVLVTDGSSSWEVVDGVLIEEEPHEPSTTVLAHRPADEGPVHASRDEAVGALRGFAPNHAWTEEARAVVWALDRDGQLELLRCLVEDGIPSGRDAAVLACLLGEEECFAEMLAQMSTAVATPRRRTLLAARAEAPTESVANVTALLGLAFWLEGNGTLANECIDQVLGSDAGHPLGRTIEAVLRLGIPPARWDEH